MPQRNSKNNIEETKSIVKQHSISIVYIIYFIFDISLNNITNIDVVVLKK